MKGKAKKWHYLHPRTSARAITLAEYKDAEIWEARIRQAKADEERKEGKFVPEDPWVDWHLSRYTKA